MPSQAASQSRPSNAGPRQATTVRQPGGPGGDGRMSDGTTELRRSSRDHEEIRRRLEAWLATRLPAGAAPTIASLEGTSANGMSSETLLFDARWTQAGVDRFERLVARVPPDVMPYNFGDSWLFDASTADQRRLQDSTVAVLAELHGIDRPGEQFAFLDPATAGDTPLRRRVARTRDWYDFAAAGGFASPLIERCFAWLDDHWPSYEGPTVVCWGDAR